MTATAIRLASEWKRRRVVALTGAGLSTASGIPDYRGEGTRARARKPIQHGEFLASAEVRKRYWARSFLGSQVVANAEPNIGHLALTELEKAGALRGIITQNVDRLHTKAGSTRVVELHGALADVVCLECGEASTRAELQDRLGEANRAWTLARGAAGQPLPDGDRELADAAIADFRIVGCQSCGGALKPDVVFFGGAVAKPVLERAWEIYRESDLVVVIGSSLAVFSGFRFVRQAHRDGRMVAIINRGDTRGDEFAAIKLDDDAGATLVAIAKAVGR